MTARYRKLPVVIEAVRYTGDNAGEIERFIGKALREHGRAPTQLGGALYVEIETPEGRMRAGAGDWIIRGVKGEFYPCKDEIFRATYESVSEIEDDDGPDAETAAILRDLAEVVNRHSLETRSATPDFLLAEYLYACICAYGAAVEARAKWHGADPDAEPDASVATGFDG